MSLLYKERRYALSFGIWHITETEGELEELSGCSAPARLTNPSRRCEYLAIRALAVCMGLDPERIDYLPSGKPFLKNFPGTISFSHTRNYAAIVVARHTNVGIDIEKRTERVVRVRHKFMHPLEEEAMVESGMDTNTYLLLHWCAKEAVFKAVTEDAIDFSHEIRVTHLPVLQSLNDVKETRTPMPDLPDKEAAEVFTLRNDSLTQHTQNTMGEVLFLRNGGCFQLEGWSTVEFVLVICHAPLTDLPVSE